jgi:hypothetical protein
MSHRFRVAMGLTALAGAALGSATPTFAQTAATGNTPTVTTPQPAVPGTPTTTTPVPQPPAAAPAPPKQTPVALAPNISVGGEIDGYYQYQFSNPRQGQSVGARIYATRQNSPTVRLAWLDIAHTAAPGGFGFKVSLATGDAANDDVPNGGSFTGESRFQSLAQFYGTYAAKSGLTVDVGKYLSPYGYDTTEAILNYNYTLTDATFLVPNYVFGVRATYPIKSPNLAASIYVVNSLEEGPNLGVEDDGGNHDVILRLNYTTPDGKFNYIPAYGFGKAKLTASGLSSDDIAPAKGNENLILFDNWLTYHLTKKITLAGEYVYRDDTSDGGNYDRRGDGYGGYYRQQLDTRNAIALRYSRLTSHTSVLGGAPLSVTSFAANEITATFEQKLAADFTVRYEYRHDYSNNSAAFGFPKGDSGTTGNQDAVLAAGIFTF